jgi:hypothetical protein
MLVGCTHGAKASITPSTLAGCQRGERGAERPKMRQKPRLTKSSMVRVLILPSITAGSASRA